MNKVIIVEGNIGTGKSTLSREIAKALPGSIFFEEPVNSNGGNPYLDWYYSDPKRWAYTMQTHLLSKRFKAHLNAQWHAMSGKGHAVLDRSYFGDVAFAYLQKELGMLSNEEFETYKEIYGSMTSFVQYPAICIYLKSTPQNCAERIAKRNRSCECNIEMSYLIRLESNIEKMIQALEARGTRVLTLDWNENRNTELSRRASVSQIAEYIQAKPSLSEFNHEIIGRIG